MGTHDEQPLSVVKKHVRSRRAAAINSDISPVKTFLVASGDEWARTALNGLEGLPGLYGAGRRILLSTWTVKRRECAVRNGPIQQGHTRNLGRHP